MSIAGSGANVGRPGDEVRFAQLYTSYYRRIREYCGRRVAAEALDDAVAETFLTLWRRIDEVPSDDAALAWVYGIALRVVGHQWRSSTRRGRLNARLRTVGYPPLAAADEAVVDGDECRLALAAPARLGDTDAEVLRLVAWEQLPVGGDVSYRDARTTAFENDPFLVLGAEKHDSGPQFPSYRGLIDELRVSNTVRYTSSFARPLQLLVADAPTVALYRFDEGSGTVLTDATGGNHGVVQVGGSPSGPVWSVDRPF